MFRYSTAGASPLGTRSPAGDSSPARHQTLPVTRSRLPIPRSVQKPAGGKRALSPAMIMSEDPPAVSLFNSPVSRADRENTLNATDTPSPLKWRRTDSLVSHGIPFAGQPVTTATAASVSGASHGTRRTPLTSTGNPAASTRERTSVSNAYGIRSDMLSSTAHRRTSLHGTLASCDRIKVCVRKRPLNDRESATNQPDILAIDGSRNAVAVLEERVRLDGISRYTERHEFLFDCVFDVDATNGGIYAVAVQNLVDTVVAGGRATCFAYGQTGSGKTHTMLNADDGLYHLAAHDLLQQTLVHLPDVSVAVSFFEIYQSALHDLLNGKRRVMACEARDGQVHIVGLSETTVRSVADLQAVMHDALTARSTGSTSANASSSRSHAILQFVLRRQDAIHGKFSFIDLAGSERGSDRANVDKQTRLEGAEINKSLLALKECIRAIDQDSLHLPFRQSKLTLVLKDSFVGNAKTCMIATVSPTASNCEHTINTLRYADRVKELKGTVVREDSMRDASMRDASVRDPSMRDASVRDASMRDASVSRLSTPTKGTWDSTKGAREPSSVHGEPSPVRGEPTLVRGEPTLVRNLPQPNRHAPQPVSTPLLVAKDAPAIVTPSDVISDEFDDVCSTETANRRRDALQNAIAILYDRVSICKDGDLLELLQDELEGILAAFGPN